MFPNEIFKTKMQEKNISISDLALAINLDRSTLSRRFSRDSSWSIQNYVDACGFFDVNPEKLLKNNVVATKWVYTNEG